MRFQNPEPISQAKAQEIFASGTGLELSTALVGIAFHEPDWRWVQGICLQFARHPDVGVRSTAAICLGHLSRIHRTLDLDIVLPVLHELAREPGTGGQASDALDDIETYLGKYIESR